MENKLNELIDRTFDYKGNCITIKKWKLVSGSYVIFTDKRTYNFFSSEIERFFLELKETTKEEHTEITEQKEQVEIAIKQENNEIKDILLNTIRLVQADKAYIGQANAICNVVTQMVNIKRLEINLKSKINNN